MDEDQEVPVEDDPTPSKFDVRAFVCIVTLLVSETYAAFRWDSTTLPASIFRVVIAPIVLSWWMSSFGIKWSRLLRLVRHKKQ